MSADIIKRAVDSALRISGFTKNPHGWHYAGSETVLVVNLQKSSYGGQYYVNLGVWVKQFGEVLAPQENQCHVRIRLKSLDCPDYDIAFDAENQFLSGSERQEAVRKAILECAVPFLKACESLSGIRDLYVSNRLCKAMVHVFVRKLLE